MDSGEFGTLIARFHFSEDITMDVRMSGAELRAGSESVPPERIVAWDHAGCIEWVSDSAKAMFASANVALIGREAAHVEPTDSHIFHGQQPSPSPDTGLPRGRVQVDQASHGAAEALPPKGPESLELRGYLFFAVGLLLVLGLVMLVVGQVTVESRDSAQKLYEATGDATILPPSESPWSTFGPIAFSYLGLAATLLLWPLAAMRHRGTDRGVARGPIDDAGLAKLTLTCIVVASSYVLATTALAGFLAPATASTWTVNVVGVLLFVMIPMGAGYWVDGALRPRATGHASRRRLPWAHSAQDGWGYGIGYLTPLAVALALVTHSRVNPDYLIPMSKSLRLAILLIVPISCQIIGALVSLKTLSALLRAARAGVSQTSK